MVDAATTACGLVAAHLAAVFDADDRAIAVDIDATAVAFCVVVHNFGAAKAEHGILAAHVDAAAIAIGEQVLVLDVAGNRHVVERHGNAAIAGHGDAACALGVVGCSTGDKASVDIRITRKIALPKALAVIKGPVMDGRLAAAVDHKRSVLRDADDLALLLAAVLDAGQAAVDHVTLEIEGVGLALGDGDTPVGAGVPIALEGDGNTADARLCRIRRRGAHRLGDIRKLGLFDRGAIAAHSRHFCHSQAVCMRLTGKRCHTACRHSQSCKGWQHKTTRVHRARYMPHTRS